VLALAPPGTSQIEGKWAGVRLLERLEVAQDVMLLRFGLPDAHKPLGLSTMACILVRGAADSGLESVVRPYTPVSTNDQLGSFTLLVKVYPEGVMSRHLGSRELGQHVEATHSSGNVKRQYPFGVQHVAMIAGGSGITPMLQALHALLGNASDTTRITMLYSNRVEADIIGRATLDAWQAGSSKHGHRRLSVLHTLTREPADSGWAGRRGRIDRSLLEERLPRPSASGLIFVCGPGSMYEAYAGPRRGEYGGLLREMGYPEDKVVKL